MIAKLCTCLCSAVVMALPSASSDVAFAIPPAIPPSLVMVGSKPASRALGADDVAPQFSPDGAWILFRSVREFDHQTGRDDAFLVGADGTQRRRLGDLDEDVDHFGRSDVAAWSPDGRSVLLRRQYYDPSPFTVVAVVDVATGSSRRLPDEGATSWAWSPDGRSLVFSRPSGTAAGLYVLAVGGSERRLTTGADRLPSWSPNGEQIAFLRRESSGSASNLALVDLSGRVEVLAGASGGNSRPLWAPDGERIILEGSDGSMLVTPAAGRVATFTRGTTSHAWSPDGSLVAYRLRTSGQLGIAPVAGTSRRRLPLRLRAEEAYAWHPDGRALVFSAAGRIGAIRVDGSGIRALARSTRGFSLSPEGRRVVFAARGACGGYGLYVVRWQGGQPHRLTNDCTILGTPTNDRIAGTQERDIIRGLGGDDVIDANPGDRSNLRYGRRDNDVIDGGSGNDRIAGGKNRDILQGGRGDDVLDGGTNPDTILGGPGNDRIAARDGSSDVVRCGAGRDTVLADPEDQVARDCERVRR